MFRLGISTDSDLLKLWFQNSVNWLGSLIESSWILIFSEKARARNFKARSSEARQGLDFTILYPALANHAANQTI